MPKNTGVPSVLEEEALKASFDAISAGELYPIQIPFNKTLTEEDFHAALDQLQALGLQIKSRQANAPTRYKRTPAISGQSGFVGFFEITDNNRTVGYRMFSDSDGLHCIRAELKPPRR